MVTKGQIRSESGKVIEVAVDSVCVHGDTPGAATIARHVRTSLQSAGITVRPWQ
jgi:UPF0271 protein